MSAARAADLGEALILASGDNKIIDICRLLTQGADVNYVHRFMHEGQELIMTPLIMAAFRGHAEAMRVLISRGAEVNKSEACDGCTALHGATQGGHMPVIELLMSNGTMIDARDKVGHTPLHLAASYGNKEAAIRLLDHGADINAKDNLGFTPLSSAASQGHLPLVNLLVLRGADLNLANNEGARPLSFAADKGHLEIVKLLVEKRAVVDQPAFDGDTSLGLASHFGHLEVVDFLLSADANINHLNGHGLIHQASTVGLNPLHLAALYGQSEVIDYLMRKGATFEAVGTIAKVCKCCGAANANMKCALCLTTAVPSVRRRTGRRGHKIQCAALTEARARYMEKAMREIEEKIARFGMRDSAGNRSES